MHSLFNPVHVYIGENALAQLPVILHKRHYVVISSPGFKARGWGDFFRHAESVIDSVSPHPTIQEIVAHTKTLRSCKYDTLVAIGGGSVLDTAKVLSVLSAASEASVRKIVQGKSRCPAKHCDVLAIPTTSGTGAEVTPFATIWDDQNKKKESLHSTQIFPHYAVIDPVLTLSLGATMTAVSGLDALSHCFESLWNVHATPYSKPIALAAIDSILDTLPPLLLDLNCLEMRKKMAWASLMGGLCISQTKTALAHSISYPVTSHLGIPHGLAAGAFLPEILHLNRQKDRSGVMEELVRELSFSKPLDERLQHLYRQLEHGGVFQEMQKHQSGIFMLLPEMIDSARASNNIVTATPDDVHSLLEVFFKRRSNKIT